MMVVVEVVMALVARKKNDVYHFLDRYCILE